MFTTTLARPQGKIPLDLFAAIEDLKTELNAVILAHYYQEPDIQDIADFIGDSLQLARAAAQTNADVIVFAGVHFMAETAKILNPDKLVLLPDLNAGCSLADSCPPDQFAAFKAAHPDHLVISYINCSAEIKAMSDIICTSSNAVKIVQQIPKEQPIIFAPDRNLGRYVMQQTGRDMLLWQGSCVVHETFSERKIVELKTTHPEAEAIAHPECETSVLRHASYIGSTAALLNYCQKSPAQSANNTSDDKFADAVRLANQASAAGKTATTSTQWLELAARWQRASDLMSQVPPSHSRYQEAQIRTKLYREYSKAAEKEAEKMGDW